MNDCISRAGFSVFRLDETEDMYHCFIPATSRVVQMQVFPST